MGDVLHFKAIPANMGELLSVGRGHCSNALIVTGNRGVGGIFVGDCFSLFIVELASSHCKYGVLIKSANDS